MRPAFVLIGLLLAAAIPACTTPAVTGALISAAAVAQSSELAKLSPEPPRHFQILLDVTLDGRTHRIEHMWTCTHEKVFSAGTMAWRLSWRSGQQLIARKLENGPFVFFREPVPGYCGVTGERNVVLDIGVANTPDAPNEVVVYHRGHRSKPASKIVSWTIRRLEGSAPKNPDPSREERRLVDFLQGPGKDLVSRQVRVTPVVPQEKGAAGTGAPVKVIVATGRTSSFIKEPGIVRTEDYRVYPVQAKGDMVAWDPAASPDDAGLYRWVYRPEVGAYDRPVDFCYAGRCYRLTGAISEIYDPVAGVILTVSSLGGIRVFGMSS